MNTHTPEPWFIATTEPAEIRTHPCGGIVIGETIPNAYNASRAVACVNACAGMADPAKEIAHLRDYAGRTHEIATKCSVVVAQREAKQQVIEDMREAIQAARDALEEARERTDPDKQTGQSMFHVHHKAKKALAKLQPFIKP